MAKKTKKSTAKKIDKRTTPKFIAHLRRLAKKRHEEAVARKAAEAAKKEAKAKKVKAVAQDLVALAKKTTKQAA